LKFPYAGTLETTREFPRCTHDWIAHVSRVPTIVSPPSRTFYEFIRVEMARLKQSPPSRRTRSDADNSFAQAKCQTKEATRITRIDAGILRDKITRVNSRHSRITFPPALGAHEPPATAGRHRKGAKLRKEIRLPVRGRNLRSTWSGRLISYSSVCFADQKNSLQQANALMVYRS
jgi:hypothetical protein